MGQLVDPAACPLNRIEPLRIHVGVYAELSLPFATPADLDASLSSLHIGLEYIPREGAFLAGNAFLRYRKNGSTRNHVLPDFLIGGHAEASGCALLTRDARRYATYFPTVRLIAP